MSMNALDFDTHKAVKNLQNVGFDEPQAEALVNAIDTAVRAQVATKADVDALRQETKADLDALRQETQAEFSGVRKDLESLRKETKAGLEILRRDLTIRLGGLMVVGIGVLAALGIV